MPFNRFRKSNRQPNKKFSKDRKYNSYKSDQKFSNRNYKNKGPNKNQNKTREEQLSEQDVGITEFISELGGFQAVIKARFSDFHVNEISLDNEVAKLTDTKVPDDFKAETIELAEGTECPSVIPKEIWQSINSMLDNETSAEVDFDVTDLSKEDRTLVHKFSRQAFGRKIVANTVLKDDKKFIIFKKFNKGDRVDVRTEWPKNKGEYVYFLVYKECLDTLEACMRISDALKMPSSAYTYAGVKDRRAKTTQWFCVRKVDPWKLLRKTSVIQNLKIGNFKFQDKPLRLGHLSGNYFKIALRNVQVSDELIEKSVSFLQKNGFINYYGLQRFGNDKEVPTYEIGKQLLLGNWKEACSLILKVKKGDDQGLDITKAKQLFNDTNDAEKACGELRYSKNKCVEGKLLAGLAKTHANDYVSALENIPRNMRLLYIHSFQSLVWNKMASLRFRKYGIKPVAGDLVLCDNDICEDVEQNDEEETTEEASLNENIKILAEADLSNYSIHDIVLPLPGYSILYPPNMNDDYKEILEEHGLSLEMPKQKVKTYSLGGAYRKLFGEVKDFSWKIMHYNEPNYNLIRSDLEELKGEDEPKSIEGGQYKALILNFSLKPSSYATMVLREILKSDTSSSSQAKLNDYHKETNTKTETGDSKDSDKKDSELSSAIGEDNDESAVSQSNVNNITEKEAKTEESDTPLFEEKPQKSAVKRPRKEEVDDECHLKKVQKTDDEPEK